MNNTLNILGYENQNLFVEKIIHTLSNYVEITTNTDKSISHNKIKTNYFLENDTWHINFFKDINQFKSEIDSYKFTNKSITFNFTNPLLRNEIKFIVYNKLFNTCWSLRSTLGTERSILNRFSDFINVNYPNINSKLSGITRYAKTAAAKIIENLYKWLYEFTDERIEWEKDKWCAENLQIYGIKYSKSKNGNGNYLNFNKITNINLKNTMKKYIKQRLLSKQRFSWHTAINYMNFIPNFLNFICELEPKWNDLKQLDRHHIEKYLEWLSIKSNSITHRNSNPNAHTFNSLSIIQTFLEDIQIKDYNIAPIKNVRILIFPSDKPASNKKPYDTINYVPDLVLEQLFNKLSFLDEKNYSCHMDYV